MLGGQRSAKLTPRAGFTLVELCVLISGLGIVLAMAIPTFARTLRISKTAEAGEHLARLVAGTQAYYADFHRLPKTEDPVGDVQPGTEGRPPPKDPDRLRTQCLPASAGPVPAAPSTEAAPVAFDAPGVPGAATFSALGFAPTQPLRFSYRYLTSAAGCELQTRDEPTLVRFIAQGDLDGDGRLSEYVRQAKVTAGGLEVDPLLAIDHAVE